MARSALPIRSSASISENGSSEPANRRWLLRALRASVTELLEALESPDPYCPVIRGEDRTLNVRMAPSRELPKLESACTTIVTARRA